MQPEIHDVIDALDDLLEAERDALLSGDLKKLTGLFKRKEALIDALNVAERFEGNELRLLDGKIKRNQELLNSALEGIRKVANRMAAFRRVRASLETYDAKGDRQVIDIEPAKTLEKRA